ncbi:MAG: transposase, partial [Gallionella sp.]|nr:transposase [Gallionella sp.]
LGDSENAPKPWPQVLPGSHGMSDKGNERFVVASLQDSSPRMRYQQNCCAHGQAENWLRQVKSDLKAGRTSVQS